MIRILVYGMVGTNRGGIETFLKKMNQNMTDDTVFDYIIEGKTCVHEAEIKSRGGKVYYVESHSKNPLKNLKDNRALLQSLKGSVDAVYFNLSSLSWIEPIKIALNDGYRVFVHSHNGQFVEANSSPVHRFMNFVNKKRLSHFDITRLTCSKPATEFMFSGNNKVEMIYNAINIENFQFSESCHNKIRAELGISSEYIIGFVGRISDQKNPLFLPDILEALLSKCDNVKMLIIGEGKLRASLEEKIAAMKLENKCLLLGNRKNVNELMQAMDVFVLPSESEGLPYVLVEAQAAGLWCVASDRITPEVDVTGNIHFLSIDSSPELWAEKILACLKAPLPDRRTPAIQMEKGCFNIHNEAKRLERILRGQ